jgi:hypothetical protein
MPPTCEYDLSLFTHGWMKNGMSITYEYDWSFFIHPSSHPWFSILEPSKRGWRGFSRPFGISLDVALLWFRSGERSNDERERERESDGGPFSPVCCLQSAVSICGRSSGARGAYQACRFWRIHSASTCVLLLLFCFFPSCFLMSILVTDLLSWTWRSPPSALSGLCFQFSPPPLIRSVGLLFWRVFGWIRCQMRPTFVLAL